MAIPAIPRWPTGPLSRAPGGPPTLADPLNLSQQRHTRGRLCAPPEPRPRWPVQELAKPDGLRNARSSLPPKCGRYCDCTTIGASIYAETGRQQTEAISVRQIGAGLKQVQRLIAQMQITRRDLAGQAEVPAA
jgi:hypothetical protein